VRIPKRFQLHLACGEDTPALELGTIRVDGDRLVATDGVIAASLPVSGHGVALSPGEPLVDGLRIRPAAWATAVKGTTGEGRLTLLPDARTHVAESAPGRPLVHFTAPTTVAGAEVPPVLEAIEAAFERLSDGFPVEILLDPEALHRLARALGAREGVRLRFSVGDDGRCRSEFVYVTPAEGGGAEGAIMPISREGRAP